MRAVTIKTDSSGASSLVYGPEIRASEQIQKLKELKEKGFSADVERMEVFSLSGGVLKKYIKSIIRTNGEQKKEKAENKKEK